MYIHIIYLQRDIIHILVSGTGNGNGNGKGNGNGNGKGNGKGNGSGNGNESKRQVVNNTLMYMYM